MYQAFKKIVLLFQILLIIFGFICLNDPSSGLAIFGAIYGFVILAGIHFTVEFIHFIVYSRSNFKTPSFKKLSFKIPTFHSIITSLETEEVKDISTAVKPDLKIGTFTDILVWLIWIISASIYLLYFY